MNDRLERKLEALRNILRLEKEKGYPNEAVMGGVDRFLEKWVEDPEVRLRLTYAQIPIPSYAQLSHEQRAQWADIVSTRLLAAAKIVEAEKPTPSPLVEGAASKRAAATRIRSQIAAKPKPKAATPSNKGIALTDPLPPMRGVTQETHKKLAKLGVQTYQDALAFFPYRHNDFSQRVKIAELVGGTEQTVHAMVVSASMKQMGPRFKATEAVVSDETGSLRAVWFNQPYLAKTFRKGTRLALSGRITAFRGVPQMESPEYEVMNGQEATHTGRLVPIYPLTEGLNQRTVRRIIKAALDATLPLVAETMPPDLVKRVGLMSRREAVGQYHYPDNQAMRERARRRLAFDELFLLQIGVLARRRDWHDEQEGLPMRTDIPILPQFLEALPFHLTGAQDRVLRDVLGDMTRPKPMSRLIQGDVGSGKTVVAAAAMLVAVANGYQAAMMAPTEILAEQHYQTISRILGQSGAESESQANTPYRGFKGFLDRPLRVAQVLGKQTRGQRNAIHELVRRGDVDIVIGTHALIQEDVVFANLGFVVVDEQHRFGVEQRGQLRQKGQNPHLLVMTATPIPRTLALTLYGDLDISVIDQMPPGRLEIKSRALTPLDQDRAYRFVRQEVEKGRQAFVICPLVEESEVIESRAAVAEYERLSTEVFSDLRVGLLHGRMKPQEKDEVMGRFRDGALDILVSTAVVEVGVDVPNATVMLVEGAERFGLAQLHQFRGRVGRGVHQSYCMFLADLSGEEVRQRLKLLEETSDGFKLAEADLRLRGPGEFFGTRQSGAVDLKVAQISSDVALLENARDEAIHIFKEDPHLERPEHAALREAEERFWQNAEEAPNAPKEEG